jgi:hypothetical protein
LTYNPEIHILHPLKGNSHQEPCFRVSKRISSYLDIIDRRAKSGDPFSLSAPNPSTGCHRHLYEGRGGKNH